MGQEPKSPMRQARDVRGWSISRLARETGLTEKTIGRLERGLAMPGLDTARTVATALAIPVDELFPEAEDVRA